MLVLCFLCFFVVVIGRLCIILLLFVLLFVVVIGSLCMCFSFFFGRRDL